MRKEIVAVVCIASDGSPAIPIYDTWVTEEEYDLGIHYDRAIEKARDDKFEGPFIPFDNVEHFEIHGASDVLKTMVEEDDT